MSFNVAVSGLNAAHKRLEVAGNNIANVGTSGFKSSRAEFSAVYASSQLGGSRLSVGDGARVASVSQDFSAGGSNSNSGRTLDMRIQGKGFFVVNDGSGLSYTRSGAFLADAEDYVVDAQNSRLQGYAANDKGDIVSGVRTDLKIDRSNLPPKATSEISPTLNLNASATSLAVLPRFDPSDPRTYTRMISQSVNDSGIPEVKEVMGTDAQGMPVVVVAARPAIPPQSHDLKQYFVKTDDSRWTSYVLIDGVNPQDPSTLSPLQIGFNKQAGGNVVLMSADAAVRKVSDTELSLRGWVPAHNVNGSWTANGAGSPNVIALNLTDSAGPALDDADALMNRAVPTFDGSDITTYTHLFSAPIFDSQGNQHELGQYVVKDGNNSWKMHFLVNGRHPVDPDRKDPLTASVVFNTDGSMQSLTGAPNLTLNNGKLTLSDWTPARPENPAQANSRWVSNGAVAHPDGVVIDATRITQHRADTARSALVVDGHAAGNMTGMSINGNGIISANFSNGLNRKIGQVMLASFTNEQGLRPISDTRWRETSDSGVANYAGAGEGGIGNVVAHSLEGSNVNLTEELVELIQAQTAYQANSKTLSTEAELMQTLIRAT